MTDRIFWGDLHSHCAISYGYGSIERAFAAARGHLDFATVTGHATWHDMPVDHERYGRIIDFHQKGFERLAANWEHVQRVVEENNVDGEFAALLSYEWHSIRNGDHNIYYPGSSGDIVEADDLDTLEQRLGGKAAFLIPHHIGYGPGNRGIDWQQFDERRSPVVEIFSGHGGSERDGGPFPMYHTMGARTYEGTVAHGLALGKRFGFVAGTDHHGGYPGHYGEGRTAVFAPELSRAAILEAIAKRHCYAVTGDKIELSFAVDGAPMGDAIVDMAAGAASSASSGKVRRSISYRVRGCDVIDRLEIVKNNEVIHRAFPQLSELKSGEPLKVRIEWGWGDKDESITWDGRLRVEGGSILAVEPCFNGDPVLAPTEEGVAVSGDTIHQFQLASESSLHWASRTRGNPSPMVRGTNALIVELEAGPTSRLDFTVNGRSFSHSVGELLAGSRSHGMRGWRSEMVLVHRAVPESRFLLDAELTDEPSNRDTDFYYLRVAQENGQWAWGSPVWVSRRDS